MVSAERDCRALDVAAVGAVDCGDSWRSAGAQPPAKSAVATMKFKTTRMRITLGHSGKSPQHIAPRRPPYRNDEKQTTHFPQSGARCKHTMIGVDRSHTVLDRRRETAASRRTCKRNSPNGGGKVVAISLGRGRLSDWHLWWQRLDRGTQRCTPRVRLGAIRLERAIAALCTVKAAIRPPRSKLCVGTLVFGLILNPLR